MDYNIDFPRPFALGMGQAVAERTILRQLDSKWETWSDVAERVAAGNCNIPTRIKVRVSEYSHLKNHIANASMLMSGRHLQHGDVTQSKRQMELFTNCSSAATTFMKYYLLLNGSGVGRCYDDDLMVVDWSKQPFVHVVMSENHKDFDFKTMESLEQAKHKYGRHVTTFKAQDSREGWAQAVEYYESLTYVEENTTKIVLFDFSLVRPRNVKIKGMQGRPSSGPVPLMNAFHAIASLKGCVQPRWWQNMYVDHYLAESVLVGGARRSARIAVKSWRDRGVLDFIDMKEGWSAGTHKVVPLWSANNSVGVDEVFWNECKNPETWAFKVFNAVIKASYEHGTGEPGFVNLHKLHDNPSGYNAAYRDGDYASSKHYPITHGQQMLKRVADIACTKQTRMIPNPCGEISLLMLGAYCTIGDIVPFHCANHDEFIEAARLTVRALIRVNLMDCVYHKEVKRTNRIGVSLTGIHEYAWKNFKLGFRDLIDEDKSRVFWYHLASVSNHVNQEAIAYSAILRVVTPHTMTTIKPSGTVSKLFGLTEGAHLPSMREYLRNVQFRIDDPLVEKYRKLGYPVRSLREYEGTVIVGFPTQPIICTLGMGSKLITASEATPEEQYRWIQLLEKYWLHGGHEVCTYGNQISYTLKYDKTKVSIDEFREMVLKYQPKIKCCSVMPDATKAFEYLPEQPVTSEEYAELVARIVKQSNKEGEYVITEDIGREHLECAGGVCPIDIKEKE